MFKIIIFAVACFLCVLNLRADETDFNSTVNKTMISQLQAGKLRMTDLPLTIIAASIEIPGPVLFLISGDRGWSNFDNTFCELLAKEGIPIVGLDANKYFWKSKTPEETTAAFVQLIESCTKQLHRDKFVLAGFSFGADIVPFVANRLPPDLKKRMSKIILLSPDRFGDFEIHLTDMLSLGISKRKYNIVQEVKNVVETQLSCIFGKNEDAVDIKSFTQTRSKIIILAGDHHYNNNFKSLTETLLKELLEKN